MKRVEGKVCIVTGGARGIGRAICESLAKEGAKVGVADLNLSEAEKVAAAIKESGGEAIGVQVDVSDRKATQDMIAKVVAAFGRLDVYFCNAGFNQPMHFLDVTEENFNKIVKVNTLGCLISMQEAAKQMIKEGHGGKIIATASITGRDGAPDFAPYAVSKFGTIALIQSAAMALTPQYDITVTGFAPGVVATPLWEQLDKDLMGIGASEKEGQAMQEFSKGILRGRVAQPEDMAGTALYLASSDSDYMTGQVVMIEGGMKLI